MNKPSFRDGIVQAVEQVVQLANQKGFRVEIETDDNGELITYTDRKVIITFSYTFDLEPNLMDHRLFTLEFAVFGVVTVTRFDNKSFNVIKFLKDNFQRIYTPIKKAITQQKADYGFNQAFTQLTQGLNKMSQELKEFDAIDKFFQVASYLTRKGFELPEYKNYQAFINDLKVNQSELYSQMVFDILEADEKVNNLGLEVV